MPLSREGSGRVPKEKEGYWGWGMGGGVSRFGADEEVRKNVD